ncbi:hypothetical protein FOZ63_025437, partial [Perkinsus olseni]
QVSKGGPSMISPSSTLTPCLVGLEEMDRKRKGPSLMTLPTSTYPSILPVRQLSAAVTTAYWRTSISTTPSRLCPLASPRGQLLTRLRLMGSTVPSTTWPTSTIFEWGACLCLISVQ